jgi:hypothetical protein
MWQNWWVGGMHAFKMLVGKPLARVHLKDRREGGITLRHMSERYVVRVGAGGNDSESWHMTACVISGICSRTVLVIFSCGFQESYFNATCMPVLQMIMSTLRADLGVCFDMDHEGFQPCQPIRDGETSAKSLTTLTHCSIQLLEKLTAEHLCYRENLT